MIPTQKLMKNFYNFLKQHTLEVDGQTLVCGRAGVDVEEVEMPNGLSMPR